MIASPASSSENLRSIRVDNNSPSCSQELSSPTPINNITPIVGIENKLNEKEGTNCDHDCLYNDSDSNGDNDDSKMGGIKGGMGTIDIDTTDIVQLGEVKTTNSHSINKAEEEESVSIQSKPKPTKNDIGSALNNKNNTTSSTTDKIQNDDDNDADMKTPIKRMNKESQRQQKTSPSSVIQFENLSCLAELQEQYQQEHFPPLESVIVTQQSRYGSSQPRSKQQGSLPTKTIDTNYNHTHSPPKNNASDNVTSSNNSSCFPSTTPYHNPFSSQNQQFDEDDDDYSVQSGYSQISFMSNMSSVSNMSSLSQMSRVQDMISLLKTETSRRRQRKQRLRDRDRLARKNTMMSGNIMKDGKRVHSKSNNTSGDKSRIPNSYQSSHLPTTQELP